MGSLAPRESEGETQVRASRGFDERLTGSYQIFLDHNQHFPSVVERERQDRNVKLQLNNVAVS